MQIAKNQDYVCIFSEPSEGAAVNAFEFLHTDGIERASVRVFCKFGYIRLTKNQI
jgi:hypothetical protein